MACCTPLSYLFRLACGRPELLIPPCWEEKSFHAANRTGNDREEVRRQKSEKALHLSLTTAMPPPPPANGYGVCPAFKCGYLQICLAYLLKKISFPFVLSYPCINRNRLSAFFLFSKMFKCLTFHQHLQEPTLTSRRILYWETVQPLSHNIFLRAFGYIVIPAEQGGKEKAQKKGT